MLLGRLVRRIGDHEIHGGGREPTQPFHRIESAAVAPLRIETVSEIEPTPF
jgi:hypothetical protein